MSKFDAGASQAPPPAPASGGSFFSKITSFTKQASFSASAADGMTGTPTAADLARKEQELKDLELALQKKEEELAQQEARAGIEHKNWPPFWPLIHHDIKNDIPDNRKAIQYAAFYSWLGIMVCLVYNLVGAIASWIAGTYTFTDGIGNFFLATIYVILGVPLSFVLWYKPLYLAMSKQGFVRFTMFFACYSLHIGFCIFATIAPPFFWHGTSFTGFMAAVGMLINGWIAVAIIYFVGAGFFLGESLISIYVIGRVFAHWRGRS